MDSVKIIRNKNSWSESWFSNVLRKVLQIETGTPEAAFLQNRLDQGADSIDSLLSEDVNLPESLKTKLLTLKERLIFSESCYYRKSADFTRVIQWPNNPKTKIEEPNYFFDIHKDLPYRNKYPWIDPDTAIGSAGSCFAMRIAHQLQAWKYNYIIEEDDLPSNLSGDEYLNTSFRMGSARSGTLFNVPSMRQMVQRAFGEWEPEKILVETKGKLRDPFRSIKPLYTDVDGFLRDYCEHTQALNRALSKCEVFIFTLGLSEAWKFSHSGEYVSVAPHNVDGFLVEPHNLNVDENVAELELLYSVFRRHNPRIKLIISVSPVPLNKTYSKEHHVVVANSLSKATLRVAAEVFCNRHPQNTAYFPSYEVVTNCTRNPWEADMRHVSAHAVERVMSTFGKMFLKGKSPVIPKISHDPETPATDSLQSLRGRTKQILNAIGGERLVNFFRR